MSTPANINTPWLVTIVIAVMLSACGQKADEEAAAAAAKAKQVAAAAKKIVIDPFVKAVQVTVGDSPVAVRFELPTRPTVGTSVPLHVRLTGLANSTALTVKVAGVEHVQVVDGADWALETLPAGQEQDHAVTLAINASGIYVIEVAVDATRDGFAKTFTFAVPVAVPDANAASASVSVAAK